MGAEVSVHQAPESFILSFHLCTEGHLCYIELSEISWRVASVMCEYCKLTSVIQLHGSLLKAKGCLSLSLLYLNQYSFKIQTSVPCKLHALIICIPASSMLCWTALLKDRLEVDDLFISLKDTTFVWINQLYCIKLSFIVINSKKFCASGDL